MHRQLPMDRTWCTWGNLCSWEPWAIRFLISDPKLGSWFWILMCMSRGKAGLSTKQVMYVVCISSRCGLSTDAHWCLLVCYGQSWLRHYAGSLIKAGNSDCTGIAPSCLHNNTLGTGSSYLLLLALLFLFPFCQILSNSPTLAVLLLTTCSLRWPPLDLLLLLRLPLLSNLWFPDPMTLCWPLTRSKSQLTWEIQGWASIQCCFLILHWNAAVPTGLAQ